MIDWNTAVSLSLIIVVGGILLSAFIILLTLFVDWLRNDGIWKR